MKQQTISKLSIRFVLQAFVTPKEESELHVEHIQGLI
jgi:hypothetical protein